MTNLSELQSTIVNTPIGQPIQILASAGSGKTRVLTERIRKIIQETQKEGVIALTFTNKAAEEMQERLHDLEDIQDRAWIATIHAVAQRILEHYGHTLGLPSALHIYENDQDCKAIFLQSLRENKIDVFLDASNKEPERIIRDFMDKFSTVKRELLTQEEIKKKYSEEFLSIFQIYQDALLESHGIDFDDILVYARRILIEQPWCAQIYRTKYKHLCVDEAQDLNKVHYEFIKALCDDQIKSVMMVGDPHQMIYGFNGSSNEYLCEHFVRDFSPQVYELKENYRNSKAVIRLANQLIKPPSTPMQTHCAFDGESRIEEQDNEEAEAIWVCDKIEELLLQKRTEDIEGEISCSNMVVIARNRFVFKPLESELEKRKIPYLLKKSAGQVVFFSTFRQVLNAAIKLRVNPKDWVNGKKLCEILAIDASYVGDEQNFLEKLASKISDDSSIPFAELQKKLLIAVHQLDLEDPNIPKLYAYLECLIKAIENQDDELERTLQELKDFENCWKTFRERNLGASLSSFLNAMALGELAQDYNPTGLTLSTVHTMKGLEKDIVFLIGMCEGVFPDYRSLKEPGLTEERNNAFVAITRSKRRIYITYPKERKMPWGDVKPQKASRFIDEMRK